MPPDPETLRQWDRRYVWHPFTQMAVWGDDTPLIIAGGDGPFLFDVEGRRYIDGVASLWCNVHGHRHPVIDAAVREQLGRVAHSTLLGLGNVPSTELARQLIQLAPQGLEHVFYSDDGATAVEVAIKMAFQYWRQTSPPEPRRTRFVAIANAYHGDTIGAVSVGGIDTFHGLYRPLLFEALFAPSPYCYRCPLGRAHPACGLACADALDALLAERGREVAAVVVEPLVQAAAGIITAPQGYLARVRAACDRHGALLVADEVAVGFGRTGTMFACEQEWVSPDLLCLGKGLTGGYLPVAATLATEAVFQAFLGGPAACSRSHTWPGRNLSPPLAGGPFETSPAGTGPAGGRTFYHGHTYTGNPLGCAAGLASLEVFRLERTLEGLPARADLLARRLGEMARMAHVGDRRQRGLMAGIELVADRATKTPYDPALRVGHRVIQEARRSGLILRPLGDVIVIVPPLNIPLDVFAQMLDIVAESITIVTGDVERA